MIQKFKLKEIHPLDDRRNSIGRTFREIHRHRGSYCAGDNGESQSCESELRSQKRGKKPVRVQALHSLPLKANPTKNICFEVSRTGRKRFPAQMVDQFFKTVVVHICFYERI